jgi:hypothetical protein
MPGDAVPSCRLAGASAKWDLGPWFQAAAEPDPFPQPPRRRKAGAGRRPHRLDEPGRQGVDRQRHGSVRLRHEVDGAQRQRVQGRGGPFAGEGGDHDDPARMLQHDPVEAGEPVHAGHLDVEGDHVGRELRDHGERLGAVPRERDLEIPFRLEDAAEDAADERGIVDHQHLDHRA